MWKTGNKSDTALVLKLFTTWFSYRFIAHLFFRMASGLLQIFIEIMKDKHPVPSFISRVTASTPRESLKQ